MGKCGVAGETDISMAGYWFVANHFSTAHRFVINPLRKPENADGSTEKCLISKAKSD
ncbi:MAG: hypothetical protein IKE94_11560 [Aeriscardovia sp.]|nr:hypothetical protein [Aeriscardovia sp.]